MSRRDRLNRLVEGALRRMPAGWLESYRMMRMSSDGQKAFESFSERWLRITGFVSRSRYLDLLEENDRLRRRIKELETKLGVVSNVPLPTSVDSVFDEMMAAQKRWLDTWMPTPSPKDDE